MNKKGLIIGLTTAALVAGLSCTAFIPGVRNWIGNRINSSSNVGGNTNLPSNKTDEDNPAISVEDFVKTYKIALPESFTGTVYVYKSNDDLLLINSNTPGVWLYDTQKEELSQIVGQVINSSLTVRCNNGDLLFCNNVSSSNGYLYLYRSRTHQAILLGNKYITTSLQLPNGDIILGLSDRSFARYSLENEEFSTIYMFESSGLFAGSIYLSQDNELFLFPVFGSSTNYCFVKYDYINNVSTKVDCDFAFGADYNSDFMENRIIF